jgi:hypothetical protein
MKLLWWAFSGSVLSAVAITAMVRAEVAREVWLGLFGPLAAAFASWFAMQRQHKRRPAGMTRLLIKAFAAKMVFFGLYVSVLLRIGIVRPFPFVISFLAYFISLHVFEAIGLHRIQSSGFSAPPLGSLEEIDRCGF